MSREIKEKVVSIIDSILCENYEEFSAVKDKTRRLIILGFLDTLIYQL
jgi:hypothetical protein